MNVLLILNDPPYGTERSYNGLRLAGSLAKRDGTAVKVFLMGDAASCARAGQKLPESAGRAWTRAGSATANWSRALVAARSTS